MSTYYRPTAGRGRNMKLLQLEFGVYMRQLRDAKGLTQRQLAKLVGVTDNHVSDVENGVRKIAPERYGQFARILGVDVHEFTKCILLHYDPYTYQGLFGGEEVAKILSAMPERITDSNDTED